jgi:hypothetical protein
MSGMPINEEDISLRSFFGGSDLMYPLISLSAAADHGSRADPAGSDRGYALAQALCSSKAMQAAVRPDECRLHTIIIIATHSLVIFC